MWNFYNLKSVLSKLKKDETGGFSLMWATAMMGVFLTVGASYDIAQVTKARSLAQATADNMALAASIAVDTKNKSRFIDGKTYNFDDIGISGQDFTNSMTAKVQYDILDEKDERLVARATVKGSYKTAFMNINPKMATVNFEVTSDVAYALSKGQPASIFFVVDNSGSMGSYDSSRVKRIDSLRFSMVGFMDALTQINTSGKNVFRTAMFPYTSYFEKHRAVYPQWGTLPETNINAMRAGGGTSSSYSLAIARSYFEKENGIHKTQHGNDKPLKFLVFMTDGANNGARTRQVCTNKQVWTSAKRAYWQRWINGRQKRVYYRPKKPWKWNYVRATAGYYSTQQVCHNESYNPVNDSSIAQCERMKAQGVQVYAIAYGVGKGSTADNFMKACSSGIVDYYKYAENGADLQTVFDQIGASIVEEVVRLKR